MNYNLKAEIKFSQPLEAELGIAFSDGAVWSVVDGESEDKSWNTYTKAGSITDNRDGTLVVKMAEDQSVESQLDEILQIIVGEEV